MNRIQSIRQIRQRSLWNVKRMRLSCNRVNQTLFKVVFICVQLVIITLLYKVLLPLVETSIVDESLENELGCKMEKIELKLKKSNDTEFFHFVVNKKYKDRTNNARFSSNRECFEHVGSTNPSRTQIVLITNFILYFDKIHREKNLMYHKLPPTDKEIEARMFELVETLQHNLNHPNIKSIHVFVETMSAVNYLRSLVLANSHKMVIQYSAKQYTFKTLIVYSTQCFMDELVMIGQQDILFGQGWDLVSYKIMSENRLMYALSRKPAYKSNCFYTLKASYCDRENLKDNAYIGAHDVFAFHVKKIFTPSIIEMFNFEQNKFGAENLLIWLFKKKLGYKVTNPCLTLYIHHQHCIPIRSMSKTRKRVNNATTSGMAGYTDKLTP